MYNTLLNHPRLKECWTALTEKGLLIYNIPTQTFKTTEKGLRFLEVFSEVDQNQKKKNNNNNNHDNDDNRFLDA